MEDRCLATPRKTRRDLLAGVAKDSGVAAMALAVGARAHDLNEVTFPSPGTIREQHRAQLINPRATLGDNRALSKEGP